MENGINVNAVRAHALRLAGLRVPAPHVGYGGREYYPDIKLPAGFGTHPGQFEYQGCLFKVLTQAEAAAASKTRARRPHRILTWCGDCRSWQFAGKITQHARVHRTRTSLSEFLSQGGAK